MNYLEYEKLLDDSYRQVDIQLCATRFFYLKDMLYRQPFVVVLLQCLNSNDATQAMKEAHSKICCAHQSRPKTPFLYKKIVVLLADYSQRLYRVCP